MNSLKLLFSVCITLIVMDCYGQDAYKKRYYVKENIQYSSENYNNEEKNKTLLSLKVKDEKCEITKKIVEKDGEKTTKIDTIPRDIKFKDIFITSKSTWLTRIFQPKKGRLKANIKFDGKYVYINPWLLKNDKGEYIERDKVYFYELKNRQSVKIGFRQWTLNALTVPLKIRFGDDDTEFSTGVNLGALFGYTWGATNFVHRKKIDNKLYDSKFTTGIFLGADKLEFSFDTSDDEKETVKTAFISIGSGFLYSYQNFTVGITGGFDFGLGENVDEWKFQGKPWVGATLGYSLFTF